MYFYAALQLRQKQLEQIEDNTVLLLMIINSESFLSKLH